LNKETKIEAPHDHAPSFAVRGLDSVDPFGILSVE
jgi:hypothetical protein